MVWCLLLPGRNAGVEAELGGERGPPAAGGRGVVVKQPPGSSYIAQRCSERPAVDREGKPGEHVLIFFLPPDAYFILKGSQPRTARDRRILYVLFWSRRGRMLSSLAFVLV